MASLPYPRRPLDNSPTDGTDAHRWFGCVGFSHGIHGIHRSFWRKIFSHRFHRCSQIRRVWHPCHTHATLCQSSHGFRRCPQMVRLRKVLWLLWEDSLVSAWVWQDAIPSYNCTDWGLKFCVFCAIRGKISQQEISVRICAICGRIFQQEVSVNSVNSVGGCSGCLVGALETSAPPGRVRGYGRDDIPSYNCTYWGLKFCVFCAIRGRISQKEISVSICDICGRIFQQEVSVGSVASVGR